MKTEATARAGDCAFAGGGEPSDPAPLDPLHQPPVDRYCDIVLTGGVTDGVVYPWAIVELARQYRFKNIGGTSVGAMAAALTAAAEYGRRRGSVTGFNEVLLKLPRKLGDDVNGTTRLFSLFQPMASTRRLFDLFVGFVGTDAGDGRRKKLRRFLFPARHAGKMNLIDRIAAAVMARLRRAVVAALRLHRDCKVCALALSPLTVWTGGAARILRVVLQAYGGSALGGALAGLAVGVACWKLWHSGPVWPWVGECLLSSLPWAVILAVVFVGFTVFRDLLGGFVQNGFGLCTGYRNDTTPPGQQSLIEWLHEGIQGAAGRPLDRPLTFRDLWEAPGGPAVELVPPAHRRTKPRSIDLRMITTNLTHGRPYGLPLDDETSQLFYRRKELDPYFPKEVLDFLVTHSVRYAPASEKQDPDKVCVPDDLFELPSGDLPLVIAARLSLSFPVLFSAVPLYAIDYEPGSKSRRKLRKCWYSDGGICSNFPVHLFDSALPAWPTFGIALGPRSVFWSEERVWLPHYYNEGRGDGWNRFGDEIMPATGERMSPASRLFGFAMSIVSSAKDWRDKTSMRMPGVRDRVVRVNLRKGEGGLNLKLTRLEILKLANDYGLLAGKELVKKFIDPAGGDLPSVFWQEHRWVRFNALLVGLRERIEAIGAVADGAAYSRPLSVQINDARDAPPLSARPDKRPLPDGCVKPKPVEPPPGKKSSEKAELEPLPAPIYPKDKLEAPLSRAQADDLQALLAALKVLEVEFAKAEMPQPYKPLPTPSMRIRPPI